MTRVELAPARPGGARSSPRWADPVRIATALVRACRPRQWVKNALVAGAPLASGRWLVGTVASSTVGALVAFCLAASAVYLVNDVVDAAEDRLHPSKRLRPIASGELDAWAALPAAAVLAGAAVALGWWLRPQFGLLLLAYLACSLAYSVRLRREPVVELTLVALGFLLRAAGGGVAAGIPISAWFLLVSGFGSLFLVAGKRYCELVAVDREGTRRASLAGYSAPYLRFVWSTAGALTVATYALWGNDVYRVRAHGAWALMSLFPLVVALLLYARRVDAGTAEAPEDVILHDRALQLLSLAWLVMVAVGAGGISGG